jgi:hypothetical protein
MIVKELKTFVKTVDVKKAFGSMVGEKVWHEIVNHVAYHSECPEEIIATDWSAKITTTDEGLLVTITQGETTWDLE